MMGRLRFPCFTRRAVPLLASVAALAAVSACSSSPAKVPPRAEAVSAALSAPASPLLGAVGSSPVGSDFLIEDAAYGGYLQARVEDEYTSATGRRCRRFAIHPVENMEPWRTQFACWDGRQWVAAGVSQPSNAGAVVNRAPLLR